jgi:hypothetical protein
LRGRIASNIMSANRASQTGLTFETPNKDNQPCRSKM